MSTESEARGQPGSTIEEEVAKAQVEWLKELLIKIGPRKVKLGVEYLRLAAFLDQGLEQIRRNVLYNKAKKDGSIDDDIPF